MSWDGFKFIRLVRNCLSWEDFKLNSADWTKLVPSVDCDTIPGQMSAYQGDGHGWIQTQHDGFDAARPKPFVLGQTVSDERGLVRIIAVETFPEQKSACQRDDTFLG